MTPDEQEEIFFLAQQALFNAVNVIVVTTGYGAFLLGMSIALYSLATRPAWGRAQTALLVCILVIFVCITWDVIYSGGTDLLEFHYSFVRTLPGGILAQGDAMANHLAAWEYLPGWPATINLLFSDGIVVWRAWILFPHDKLWRSLLTFLMIANIGINIADCIWDDIEVTLEESSSTILDWLSSVMSLAVNIFATLLIAWKAWSHHRVLAEASIHKRTRVENILLLLVESGAVYCAIQSIYAVFILMDVYATVSFGFVKGLDAITSMSIVAAACYPVAVVVLIHGKNGSPIVETMYDDTRVGTRIGENHPLTTIGHSSGRTAVSE
ncbi:hypothetical protein BT96DRAFT_937529 [Gymnopus androsaceus JB14]|uniref:Uncharacterized protein n=1 Tax=Gymnopus androsaceus JB14 TaxID=1447944 RepID=A0A6A4HUR6_9AGAR|nr:hypothetical protein BT96DRAFT_937529 [Gymnopus androsaceus JB14]